MYLRHRSKHTHILHALVSNSLYDQFMINSHAVEEFRVLISWYSIILSMMTSSNGNNLRVTDHLCGDFTGHPHKDQWRGAFMFSLNCAWINGWVNNLKAGDLRRYRDHYDVTVMFVAIECFSTIIGRRSVMTEIHRKSMMSNGSLLQAEFRRTDNNVHIHSYDTHIFGYVSVFIA